MYSELGAGRAASARPRRPYNQTPGGASPGAGAAHRRGPAARRPALAPPPPPTGTRPRLRPASPTTNPKDWVGVWATGQPDSATTRIVSKYTGGGASGSVSMTIPGGTAAGTYEIRLFANDSWTRLAVSNSFTITAAGAVSLTAAPT